MLMGTPTVVQLATVSNSHAVPEKTGVSGVSGSSGVSGVSGVYGSTATVFDSGQDNNSIRLMSAPD